jgi:hypothetical protein
MTFNNRDIVRRIGRSRSLVSPLLREARDNALGKTQFRHPVIKTATDGKQGRVAASRPAVLVDFPLTTLF